MNRLSPFPMQKSDLICSVCGGVATGIHYEVVSCEACKSFFRRSVVLEARYSCRRDGACDVNPQTRIACKLCRLTKCLSVGMKREAVQLENTLNAKRLRANTPQPLLSCDEIVISDCIFHNWAYVQEERLTGHCSTKGNCSPDLSDDCEHSVLPPQSPSLQSSLPLQNPPFHELPLLQSSQPASPALLPLLSLNCTLTTTQSDTSSIDETHFSTEEMDISSLSDCSVSSYQQRHSREPCSSKACILCRTIDDVLTEVKQEGINVTGVQNDCSTKPCSFGSCQGCSSSEGTLGSGKLNIQGCDGLAILPELPIVLQQMGKMFGLDEEIEEVEKVLICIHKWAVSIPSFKSLTPDHQTKLLQSSWCDLCVLKFAAVQNSQEDTFIFSDGCSYSKQQVEDQKCLQILYNIKNCVSYWLHNMNVDRTELDYLMTLLLLNPDATGLDKSAMKPLLDMQGNILESLQSHTQKQHASAHWRMSQLLLRLGSIKSLSAEFRQLLTEKRPQYGHNKLKLLDKVMSTQPPKGSLSPLSSVSPPSPP